MTTSQKTASNGPIALPRIASLRPHPYPVSQAFSWRKLAKVELGPVGRLRLSWYRAATAAGTQPLSQRWATYWKGTAV